MQQKKKNIYLHFFNHNIQYKNIKTYKIYTFLYIIYIYKSHANSKSRKYAMHAKLYFVIKKNKFVANLAIIMTVKICKSMQFPKQIRMYSAIQVLLISVLQI